jgi:hypothetical protein
MERLVELQSLIASDTRRKQVLQLVQALGLPDCWVAAGFVRSRVWDHLHQYVESPLPQDIDVIWFDPQRSTAEHDIALEKALHARDATLGWSVKNQARMCLRNGDRPYRSATDAMRYWPETATAVGVRMDAHGKIEVAAPFGLDDLFGLIVRPTERFVDSKRAVYLERLHAKQWQARWPRLTMAPLEHRGKGIATPCSPTTGTGMFKASCRASQAFS